MEVRSDQVVFIDTSIQIGRRVHRPEIEQSIRSRLASFPRVTTGLVVRGEFKRRLLMEAQYLLTQFKLRGSFEKVRRHVQDSLPPADPRKKQICLQTLTTIDEKDTDEDRTERAKLFLRDLLRFGLQTFDAQLSLLLKDSGCARGLAPIQEKKKFLAYEFGPKRCEQSEGKCRIGQFLSTHRDLLQKVADYIATLPLNETTDELRASEAFIRQYLASPSEIEKRNACTIVGDLLIALESSAIPTFYTMNYKESRHLCQVLGQRMIFRHPNADHAEIDCPAGERWHLP